MLPTQRTTRLAPSPTGALHLGNARTFLITWAIARQRNWRIVLRIEDLDTPRVKLAGGSTIAQTIDLLEWLGMSWDVGPIIQSGDQEHHVAAMHELARQGLVYPNALSRRELSELLPQSAPQEGSHEVVFPAYLRPAERPRTFDDGHPAWRCVVPDTAVRFMDEIAGPQAIWPARTIGDFIVWTRRDPSTRGQAAYQLAVVVDDARQGVTDVIRGDDLLESAARQMLLCSALGTPAPTYWHVPLVRGEDGRRLAKRHGDTRLDTYRAQGCTPERIIGLVAWWSGVCEVCRPMSAQEFRGAFDVRTLPSGPVHFSAKEHAWLLA